MILEMQKEQENDYRLWKLADGQCVETCPYPATIQLTALRQIDCHYSLPREHELSQRCDREKNQVSSVLNRANHSH